MNPFEWFMAWRYIWARKSDGFIHVISGFSLLGITLGVATLLVVMSVMNGFRHELSQKILAYNSHLTVSMGEKGHAYENFERDTRRIQSLEGVVAVYPVIDRQLLLTFKGASTGVSVRALPYKDLLARDILCRKNKVGSLESFKDANFTIALGTRLAQKLQARLGDIVTLISPDGQVTPFGRMPKMQMFQVVAALESGLYEYDSTMAYIPFKTAQLYFDTPRGADQIEIFLKNPYGAEQYISLIQEQSDDPLTFVPWATAHASFFEVLKVERNVMFIILSLIILIAAFNIVSGLTMLVKDKTATIAILKTMGASPKNIMVVFCIVGSSIGIVGTGIGVLLGLLVASHLEPLRLFLQNMLGMTLLDPEFYFLSELPVRIDGHDVISIALYSLGLSIVATLYPSWRAARLNPVTALRYE